MSTFTSSQIYRLMTTDRKGGFGAAALSYIRDVRYEQTLKRKITTETWAPATAWGHCLERYAFDNLTDLDWQLVSNDRLYHPTLMWSGIPDIIKPDHIGDIKCPFTLSSMMQQLDCFGSIDKYRSEWPEYYWQLVSNAILANVPNVTAVVFCPTIEMLSDIMADVDGDDDHGWLARKPITHLPYLIEGTIDPINSWTFTVPQEDKELLTARVTEAQNLIFRV